VEELKIYEALANHLDQGVVMGSPKSPALIEILKVLFPIEEAKIATKLPMKNQTIDQLKELFPEQADSLETILNSMVKHGTVFTSQRSGQERKYRLMPSVVGWAETPYWAGNDTEQARKLAPLWMKYRNEAFGKELARNDTPVMRVIPISETLQDPSEILPFDVLKPMIENASYRAVGKCPCRQQKKYLGEGCEHKLENCLHFGSMGRYMVEQGMARELTVDETINILKSSNEEGLVHIIDNVEGHMGTICNCCGCCCVFMQTSKQMGLRTLSASSYTASVNTNDCVGCGTCEDRCPMDAITVGAEDVAGVDESICLGCGVCVPSCDVEAVALVKRSEANPPFTVSEFMAKRFKQPNEEKIKA
jgi:electron transport complex protein RnfB